MPATAAPFPPTHRPLRIAIPIHSLGTGGVERVALRLASEWERTGHEVTLILGRSEATELCSTPPLNFWQLPTRMNTAGWQTPWMLYCLLRFLKSNRLDVIFVPGNTYAIVAAVLKLLLGEQAPPLVLKVSNALDRPDMPPAMQRGYRMWLRLQGRLFDRLIGLSDPMAREIRGLTGAAAQKVCVIANPILEQRRLRRLARIERARPSAWGVRYLAAGRLVPQKNYPLMLRAFARAARPADSLVIAGEGPERSAIERLIAELRLGAQVTLVGHVASIDPLMAEADALILSSAYEGLPGVVVEALAAGLPVLATDCCVSMAGLLDGGRTGLLVQNGDEAAFARGIESLRSFEIDPARARAIAAGYAVEGAAAHYIEMMRELATSRDRHPALRKGRPVQDRPAARSR